MRNICLILAYKGTNYCGWQRQRANIKRPSIQQVIEECLHRILREDVRITGAARTDSGVHALIQVANFKTSSPLLLKDIQKGLNGLLPPDIVVQDTIEVPIDFHSCYSSSLKHYRYIILNSKIANVFISDLVWQVSYPLDLVLMSEQINLLKGRHNFVSFRAANSSTQTSIRTIKEISLTWASHPLIYIDIKADGFLYHMVRNIVGTLVEIGRRHITKDIREILEAKDRRLAGPTAPAKGLFLVGIRYYL